MVLKNRDSKHRAKIFILFMLLVANMVQAQNETIVFSPHWIPQAQFAGYYVALDQGFYKEVGLDVEITHPSAEISSLEFLKTGKAHIVSSFLMDGMELRINGLDIVNIGQLSQHSALMMVTKKKSGIATIEQLQGKRMGIWSSGFDDILYAFMKEKAIEMEVIPILNTINLFLMDGVDALTVMNFNEYDQIINSGVNEDELNKFYFANYGYDIPEDGLYCLEETYNSKKESLKKFVLATLKGWEYASNNREYTIELVVQKMKQAHLSNNRPHQRWMLDRVLEVIVPGYKEVQKGELSQYDFVRALDLIRLNSGDNKIELTIEEFYKSSLK